MSGAVGLRGQETGWLGEMSFSEAIGCVMGKAGPSLWRSSQTLEKWGGPGSWHQALETEGFTCLWALI